MNRSGKAAVFVLAVSCAFLTGFICGYFLHLYLHTPRISSYYEPIDISEVKDYSDYTGHPVRKDILFYQPQSDAMWVRKLEEIPEGKGRITGSFFIDDEPAAGLMLALIIAPGRKTQTITVDEEGDFTIAIIKDKYYFHGIAIYNFMDKIHDKICVNKVEKFRMRYMGWLFKSDNKIVDEFEELAKKHGPEKASNMVAEKVETVFGEEDKCLLVVADNDVELPIFHYRKPLKIISPPYNSTATTEKLKFVWEAISHAESYEITVQHIKQEGRTTYYHQIMSCRDIENNFIRYLDAMEMMAKRVYVADSQRLQPGNTYGVRVIAYDDKGRVITTSGENTTNLVIFRVK